MKIAMGQLNVKAGRPLENIAAMKVMIQKAKEDHADLIVFPELCVSGYLLADKWHIMKRSVNVHRGLA